MPLRRGKTTPYEVMRQRQRQAAADSAPTADADNRSTDQPDQPHEDSLYTATAQHSPSHTPSPTPTSTPTSTPTASAPATPAAATTSAPRPDLASLSNWLSGGEPMVLRVPRGVAIIVGLSLLALVAVAYGIGHVQGSEQAQADPSTPSEARDAPQSPQPPQNPDQPAGNRSMETGFASQRDPERLTTEAGSDPRQPGLNYMILATYEPEHADRLARFMAERDVETVQVPVWGGDAHQVWAVSAGFTSNQLGSSDWQSYRDQLRSHGRQWQAYNDGHGDSLHSMYMARYDP